MVLEKYLATNNKAVVKSVEFVVLLSITMAAPLLHNQIITGSLVNAVLFISVAVSGIFGASLICLLPSIFALYTGTLPFSLAPLIPFIMAGNLILVLTFYFFKKYNYWLGAVGASLLKFLFLFIISSFAANYFLSGTAAKAAVVMFSWPQLLTALSGSVLAYFIFKFSKTSYGK
jgi:hypothetical protein